MALATNAFTSYSAIGNREDLIDTIYNIAPTETPFLSGVASVASNAVLHEWQTDSLAAAAANNQLEGDDQDADAATPTTRLSNTCAISKKIPRVTGTQEVVRKAGRVSEMDYQVAKRALELKRDMETNLVGVNTAENTGGSTTARITGSYTTWVTTNTSNGAGGADGSAGNSARTDGTQRALTESLLQTVLQAAWDAGGDPDCLMAGSFNKRKISTFTGNATREVAAEHGRLHSAISYYESDWGMLEIIPNRFQRARDLLVLQKSMWAVAYLRQFQLTDLSKTGDSERKQLLAEYALEARNEAASGAVWDLTTS